MGSFIEINDTFQITKAQGFPTLLDIETHVQKPFSLDDLGENVFDFHDKKEVRIFHAPPVRTFLVENNNDKWIYWGLAHILSITHNLQEKTTSGTFTIIKLNTPDEMQTLFPLIDGRPDKNYFTA